VPDALREVEDWFVARGVPHLIDGYSARRDVLTRALPVLSLIFVAEVLGATELEWPWWANLLALIGGLAALLGIWAGANRFRMRPALARPDDVGVPELAIFVLAPAVLPLLFGGHAGAAALTAVGNLAAIGLVYVGISYGVVPLTKWAAIHLLRQLGSVFGLSIRALPLLLVFGVLLVVNTEVWQMSSTLDTVSLAAVVTLFVAVGTALLAARIPREVHGLETWDGPDDLARRLANTPAEHLVDAERCSRPPPLRRRHWANLGLVLLFAQGLQVLLVALSVGAFFAGFGILAITPETAQTWTGAGLDRWASLDIGDRDLVLSGEVVNVAVFIGALAGLSFAISALTDESYRQEFFDDVISDLRQVLAVRAAYLAVLGTRRGEDGEGEPRVSGM
jgi:hypothetical protein